MRNDEMTHRQTQHFIVKDTLSRLKIILNMYISARFDNIKKLNVESVNNLAQEFGKEQRTSENKVKNKVKILKEARRKLSGAKSLGGSENRKRKLEELGDATFPWPSQSEPSSQNQSQGVFNFLLSQYLYTRHTR